MKLETFFEKFDQFADASDAVTKMRQLILELAVQGRLVPQDSRDTSAAQELAELDLGILEVDPRFDIPANWVWAPLEPLLLMMKNGFNGKPNKLGGHYKVTRIETIARGTIDMSRVGFADELPVEVVEKHLIQNGDILFSHINSEPHLGKTAICTFNDPTLIHGVNLLLLRTKPQIDPLFLNTAFKELRVSGYFVSIAQRAINQSSINQKNLGKTLIPVPPLAEQKRIVAKVDELMALCDRLEAQQQERETRHTALARASLARFADAPTPANLNFIFHPSYTIPPADLRKSILTLAVQGKLVPQDPNDEPAEKALARLDARGGNAKIRRSVPTEVSRPDTLDVENLPESWVIESTARLLQLGAILDLKDGNHGANHPKVAEFTETGLPFITAAQVSDNGQIDYEGAYKVSGDALKRLRVGFAKPNDVIYTHKGSVGRVAICDRECVLTPQTTYYRVNAEVLCSGFVRTNLFSPLFQDQVDLVKRQTTRDFVSINAQYHFFLRIPPLAEQRRIVAKVEQLMALVDALEQQLTASRTTGEKLLEALVAELTAA